MKAFAALFAELDETTRTGEKVAAMARYFRAADPADAAWAVYFLTGRKPKQVVPTKLLRQWATELAGVPDWLFEESYHAVADLAETMALLVPPPTATDDRPLARWVEDDLLPLRGADPERQKRVIRHAWDVFGAGPRFVWNKLITGQLRVGVSQLLVVRALAEAAGVPAPELSHRLMGDWQPTPDFFRGLVGGGATADASRPYPFFLASPLEADPATLGDVADWAAEWKWDGIRSQLVRRAGQTFLWSRGEELVTDRYPEVGDAAGGLPDGTVIDGELLPWGPDGVRPFADLQKRIGRKTVGKKVLAEVPVVLLAYDLLEWAGEDVRDRPWDWRRATLEQLLASGRRQPPVAATGEGTVSVVPGSNRGLTPPARQDVRQVSLFADAPPPAALDSPLKLSPVVSAATWDELAAARADSRRRGVEGFLLKRRQSPYRAGRVRGDWWKWKIAPLAVDAVLVSSQRGSGKRAGLYTDHTFAVWDAGRLVPFAKAYSGLTDAEIRKVDAFIKAHTTDRFGPVRAVTPELVMEIGFEGIQASPRHKSGVAVRFPRILRWRHDKQPPDADTLDAVKGLLAHP